MSATPRASALAPFRIRAFRFQWPADLATSCAFEMETIILAWYVLVETRSVLLLTLFASLQFLGTLIAPLFGVMGDRVGHRNVLSAMRAFYALAAGTMTLLIVTGALTPVYVFVVAGLVGLVRPSDIGMRAALVADTMPPVQLVGAMGVQRTTQDIARMTGALTGAALVAVVGMGFAYCAATAFYAVSVLLTLKAGSARAAGKREPGVVRPSPWRDLKEGLAHVRRTPHLFAIMGLAFFLNMTAFPQYNSLLPYVAREIYFTDQTGLAWMIAGAACGALTGSLFLSRYNTAWRPMRLVIFACVGWYLVLLVFALVPYHTAGIVILFFAGLGLAGSQVPMAAVLLRTAGARFRGRVMGIRMLAIYGNVPGLLAAGWLIDHYGYQFTGVLYSAAGIALTVLITWRWREHLWRPDAPANTR